jgi:hypothetical protein
MHFKTYLKLCMIKDASNTSYSGGSSRKTVSLSPVRKVSETLSQKTKLGPGIAAHACNYKYSRGGYLEDCGLRPAQRMKGKPYLKDN